MLRITLVQQKVKRNVENYTDPTESQAYYVRMNFRLIDLIHIT